MLRKALFFIGWIGIFIISIIGIIFSVYPIDNRLFFTYNIGQNQQIYVIFLAVSILYFILSLIKFVSLFKKNDGYLIDGPNGEVLVSTDSIKSIIKEALETDGEVKNLKINCGKHRKKYKITLFVELHTQRSIAEKSIEIQKIVKDELFKKLELEISIVEIKISKISTKSE